VQFDDIPVQDLGLQACEQLFVENHSRNQQIVCAHAIAAVGVHRAAVARIVALSPLTRNDRDAAVAAGAFQESSEETGRACISRLPFDDLCSPARGRPLLFGNNSLFRSFPSAPFTRKLSAVDALTEIRLFLTEVRH